MATLHLSAQIWREEGAYVAHCPELRVTSEGSTFEDAQQMLREAVELMLSDMTPEEVASRWQPTAWTGPLEVTVPEPLGQFHAA
ncbi:MAG TPA: type II toxin-antitoxin system HicB family antitoxin [Streptosporangiaceae bacterium]|jgi:predicted RNase H-like HicB family nuclease|nr:type II toxin-antitoxin system HicB family antitoxin [Streptosporangiaceae bacterium]HYA51439.1 type II toxin-antitoxin system HicB family antitoxin [Streptosporangiaceae bacterium]